MKNVKEYLPQIVGCTTAVIVFIICVFAMTVLCKGEAIQSIQQETSSHTIDAGVCQEIRKDLGVEALNWQ